MQERISDLIRNTAAQVRARDFLWTAGISAGVAVAIALGTPVSVLSTTIAWIAFLVALGIRYSLSTGRAWAQPVQRIVDLELDKQKSELANLRFARDVAEVLPEPLFILDADGVVEHANPASVELVGSTSLEGRHFAAVLRAPDVFEAAEKASRDKQVRSVEFVTTGAVEKNCRAFIAPLTGDDDSASEVVRTLVFVRDLTTERRLEKMRADFVASASHELRTPLASVLGFIETLRGHAKTDPKAQEKFLKIMQSQAERMQRLVSDLMSLSRIEVNEHVPPNEMVNIADIASDVVESLTPLFDNAETIIDVTIDPDADLNVIGDRDEIFQAVQNLIDNGVKYGGDPAMIKVNLGCGVAPTVSDDPEAGHRAGDAPEQIAARLGDDIESLAYVQIRDFGPGIQRGDLPRLTERFYRVNVERSRKGGGTGLGLAIVKHIMNRHKGGFQIESRLAAGTAFTCYFPSAPVKMTANDGNKEIAHTLRN